MKLSFITVVRNALPQLQKTLRQLFELKGFDIEIVVVDGNSSDGTQAFLAGLKVPNFKYISEPDSGIYNAMNKGIRLANGKYFYFLNAGDELYNLDSFKRIYETLDEADIYYSNIMLSDSFDTKLRIYPDKLDLNFWFHTHMCHQAVIFKSDTFSKMGHYNEKFKFAADFDFLFRAWNNPKLKFEHIDDVLAVYDLTGTSADPKNYNKVVAEYKKIQRKTLPVLTYWKAQGFKLFKESALLNNNLLLRLMKAVARRAVYFFIKEPVGQFDFYSNTEAKANFRVLHLSTYAGNGGAAIAAVRLNNALNEIGVQSQMACMFPDIHHPAVTPLRRNKGIRALRSRVLSLVEGILIRLGRASRRGLLSLGMNSIVDRFYLSELIRQFNPDLVHIHWINHGFLNIEDIAKLGRPIVWTFHDMWPFLGAEHLASDNRYKNGYIDETTDQRFDIDQYTFLKKKKHWHPIAKNVNIVCPSNWMKEVASENSLWTDAKMHVVANLVDSREFRPIDRATARDVLKIPNTIKRVIVFGASSPFIEPIKGFPVFLETLKRLTKGESPEETFVITFGASAGSRMLKGFGHKHFESTKSADLLSLIYSAADVMVVTSAIESFCLVAAEAHACGVPVVCFDTAGLKDVVAHKETGYRAKLNDIDDLVVGINWVLDGNENYSKLSLNARQRAEKEFDSVQGARAHYAVYEHALKAKPALSIEDARIHKTIFTVEH